MNYGRNNETREVKRPKIVRIKVSLKIKKFQDYPQFTLLLNRGLAYYIFNVTPFMHLSFIRSFSSFSGTIGAADIMKLGFGPLSSRR